MTRKREKSPRTSPLEHRSMTKTWDVVNAILVPSVGIESAVWIIQRDEGRLAMLRRDRREAVGRQRVITVVRRWRRRTSGEE